MKTFSEHDTDKVKRRDTITERISETFDNKPPPPLPSEYMIMGLYSEGAK